MGDVHSLFTDTMIALKVGNILMERGEGFLHVSSYIAQSMESYYHQMPNTLWTIVCSFVGYNKNGHKIDISRVPMIANNDVGGTSPKNMVHLTQMMVADRA